MLVKAAEKKSRGPVMATGITQPPTRAFMDDMTIATKTIVEGRWMLEDLERLFTWARMRFKPTKSRSLVIKKGKPKKVVFKIAGQPIPTIQEKPIKCLGKWFNESLSDTESIASMSSQADQWMKAIDKSGLPGSFKSWCYQHGVLPRLIWPLFVYDVPISTVEALERKVSGYLRRWLNVPRSLSSVGLYSTGCKLQLPLTSLAEEYKVTKVRQAILLRDSADNKVSKAGIEIKTGRKWRVDEAVRLAEERLRQADIVGTVTHGRLGLGCVTRTQYRNATVTQRRELIQAEVRKNEEETRLTRAVSQTKQGSWMRWESVRARKVSWNDMWNMETRRLKFAICSVYDVLPTPTNLTVWGLSEDPSCKLCGKRGTLEHVLSACPVALADGRYTWRHNEVLEVLAAGIDIARKKQRVLSHGPRFISFVREVGENKGKKKAPPPVGILGTANDWEMRADVKKQLRFPDHIAATKLRPDIVLWSQHAATVVLIELTVPHEERVDEAHERKRLKYDELVGCCRKRGWKTWCLPVEIGCRGFASQSVWRAFKILGILGSDRRKIIEEAGKRAENASLWIWNRRDERHSQQDQARPDQPRCPTPGGRR